MVKRRSLSRKSPQVLEVIRSRYPSFSEAYRIIADFVIGNMEMATFKPLNEISGMIGVSDATLIRFSKDLGFSGFKEFREHLADTIRKIIYSQTPAVSRSESSLPILEKIKRSDIDYINRTIDGVSPRNFARLIDEIMKASRIFTMGWRISSFLAEFLVFQLRRLGYPAFAMVRETRPLLEQVLSLSAGDLLIVFDQLIYSTEVFKAVDYVGRNLPEVKIVTVTNDPLAPIVQYADLSFFIDLIGQKEFSIISLTAPMCFINTVIEEVFIRNPRRAKKNLNRYEEIVLSKPEYAMTLMPHRSAGTE
jgi:DNA-binding MurR/RpiR family transcriptional regulator